MATRNKPRVHARDHEHGGADPSLIHYEDVGDEGGGTPSGLQSFCTAEDSESAFGGSTPHDLLFTHSYSFNTNDPATFDVSGNHVRILQAGGYLVFGQLNPPGFTGETGVALVEIYDVYGTDADGNRVNGISPTDTPGPAITSRNLLPGAGGFMPTLQYMTFINLRDDYAFGGTRPAVWPVTMHMRMDWSATSAHTLFYGLSVMRFG